MKDFFSTEKYAYQDTKIELLTIQETTKRILRIPSYQWIIARINWFILLWSIIAVPGSIILSFLIALTPLGSYWYRGLTLSGFVLIYGTIGSLLFAMGVWILTILLVTIGDSIRKSILSIFSSFQKQKDSYQSQYLDFSKTLISDLRDEDLDPARIVSIARSIEAITWEVQQIASGIRSIHRMKRYALIFWDRRKFTFLVDHLVWSYQQWFLTMSRDFHSQIREWTAHHQDRLDSLRDEIITQRQTTAAPWAQALTLAESRLAQQIEILARI